MDATKRRSDCPDCGGALQPITLFDRAESGRGEMQYGAGAIEPRMFLGLPITRTKHKLIGKLQGVMCSTCGRVLLYAEPIEDADS